MLANWILTKHIFRFPVLHDVALDGVSFDEQPINFVQLNNTTDTI